MQTLYFEDLCRVCLDKKPTQHNIFECRLGETIFADGTDFEKQDAAADCADLCVGDALQMITALEFAPDDGLPAGICAPCEQRVLDAFLLRQHVERSHQTLLEMRNNSQSDAEQQPNANHQTTDNFVLVERPKPKSTTSSSSRRGQAAKRRKPESAAVKSRVNTFAIQFSADSDEVQLIDAEEAQASGGEQLLELSAELQEAEAVVGEAEEEEEQQQADGEKEVEAQEEEQEEEEEDAVSFLLANSVAAAAADELEVDTTRPSRPIHTCQTCGRTFSRKSNLVDHLRLHSNIRPFVCAECDKSFVQLGNLRAHMRIHTKERPFGCDICGKTYNQSGALKVHLRVHTNERAFKCKVCEKAFTNSTDRNKHERVHDTSGHLRCDLCPGRTFAQRINYVLHMRKRHAVVVASVEEEKKRAKKVAMKEGEEQKGAKKAAKGGKRKAAEEAEDDYVYILS